MSNKSFLNCQLLNVKFLDESDERFHFFEGYASTFGNKDHGGDIVMKGAFEESLAQLRAKAVPIEGTNFKKIIPILWHHKMDKPIGSFVEMREDERGLYVKGIMNKSSKFVRDEVMPALEIASVSDMSIGYVVEKEEYKDGAVLLKKLNIKETSLVSIPMNDQASISHYKSVVSYQDLPLADRDAAWNAEAAIQRVRELFNIEDVADDNYKKAFLWHDEGNKENLTSYKLPIADVVDGQLKAIPRGIFAAAGALRGARGGVDIPDGERNAVISNVERHYEKMGLDSPFQETRTFRIDDLECYSERELESLFKNGIAFNAKSAKTIISVLKDKSERDASEESQRDVALKAGLEKLLTTLNN